MMKTLVIYNVEGGDKKEAVTNAPTSLLFTALAHARSDHVSDITAWGQRPPPVSTLHPHLCGWTTGGTKSKPKRYLRFRQDRVRQRAVTSHTAQWWGVISTERTGRGPLEFGGRVMLCERMQVGLSSSCPRVD